MKLFTIGFTKTTAENFFNRIKKSGANKIVDVRLNNVSQLAGFAKRDDLKYFSSALCNASYEHLPQLAPTKDVLDQYKKNKGSWENYVKSFQAIMETRKIENLPKEKLDGGCLLCSEDKPHHCHRRLVAEYLQKKWTDVEIIHL